MQWISNRIFRQGGDYEKAALYLMICFLFLCGCGSGAPAEAERIVELAVNDVVCDITPYADGLNTAGGIFDSTGENLPTIAAKAGDEISLRFITEAPESVSVRGYDIFNMKNNVLGAPSSRSDPYDMEFVYEEDELSVLLEEGASDHQLLCFICDKGEEDGLQYGIIVDTE